MDIHDMGARSEAGNKYLLVIVGGASKFLFTYLLPNKSADNVAKKLLKLLLIFGIPCLCAATQIRSSPQRLYSTFANSST